MVGEWGMGDKVGDWERPGGRGEFEGWLGKVMGEMLWKGKEERREEEDGNGAKRKRI